MKRLMIAAIVVGVVGTSAGTLQAQFYSPYCDQEYSIALSGAQATRADCLRGAWFATNACEVDYLDALRDAQRTFRECKASYRYAKVAPAGEVIEGVRAE